MPTLATWKQTYFVLWRPFTEAPPPRLVIGRFRPGVPPTLEVVVDRSLARLDDGLWGLSAVDLDLPDGVYHYFFDVQDSRPGGGGGRIRITDPFAWTVDWRLLAPRAGNRTEDQRDPAGVVKVDGGLLVPCDSGGETIAWGDDNVGHLPSNASLVIYEIPASWTRRKKTREIELDVGTFRDVRALVEETEPGGNFSDVERVAGAAHLIELGINAIELTPPADSWIDRQWGYATSNYCAPDGDLGTPARHSWPTALTDFAALVKACHGRGVRVFADMAMGFANHCPWENLNYWDFHVNDQPNADPEDVAEREGRQSWGGQLFKYAARRKGWDPVTGENREGFNPARRFMLCQIAHWVKTLHIDGIRVDSVKTIKNWDFVGEARAHARACFGARAGEVLPAGERDARFLVVGEVLDDKEEQLLISQDRLDGIWNEPFKRLVRQLIVAPPDDPVDFVAAVERMIDCRRLSVDVGDKKVSAYTAVHHVVNYVTSHDVEGIRNERLLNLLVSNGLYDVERRIALAFGCLLTAVGIPMIFAGEEFADQHDLATTHPQKQMDTVNFERVKQPWRRRIFDQVSRLVRLRIHSMELADPTTRFLHFDTTRDGRGARRIAAWARGEKEHERVVVLANFSDWGTERRQGRNAEYVVPGWPPAPAGGWYEVIEDQDAPQAGSEPIAPWSIRVYTDQDMRRYVSLIPPIR